MKERKVFCLGFQKTGTSSLGRALETLGYRTAGYYQFRDLAGAEGLQMDELRARALRLAAQYDAFKDTPWPLFYAEFDAAYPGSRFILIERDEAAWIKSVVDDFGHWPNEIHRVIYGSPAPVGDEQTWLARYRRHNADVKAYFADRPGDFLSLKLPSDDLSFASLCAFLDEPEPDAPWPHANSKADKRRRMFWAKVREKIGSAL